ncbi:DNA polymerase delta subunit 4 [Staphylotrichum tortipilum]|uniref:DNA polymerase delta subunit 4 n=1 Tax=Staphylotrichum tortipilum TaxID=2831512 RepID=A0AAN6MRX9_9PEZI|nr:DNA polymerase delta subunit 4 [Staphylotrichum longicolle]
MPPTTRRSTRSAGPAAGKQSTLSFKHKVTKAIKTGKEGYKSPARAKEYIPDVTPSPPASPTRAKKASAPASDVEEDEAVIEPKEQEKVEVVKKDEDGDKTVEAAAMSDKAIERYWAGIEASREARAVHKKHGEGLSTGEKVLRYFDVSSQYGPCIGIARVKRWQRAQRLGLNPPVEVLAVLLKEGARGKEGFEKAHMDELLNATAVGAVGA